MADKKISQLTALTTTAAPDLLMIVDDPNGTPVSKKITIKNLFGAVPANTVFSANVSVSGNKTQLACNVVTTKTATVNNFIMTKKAAPSSNNAATATVSGLTPTGPITVGTVWFSNTHLYIATDSTTIKRVALSVF
jgi:hypothetical protein